MENSNGPNVAEVIIVQGSYSYTTSDGTVINPNYIDDNENGFKPEAYLWTSPRALSKPISTTLVEKSNGSDAAEVIIFQGANM